MLITVKQITEQDAAMVSNLSHQFGYDATVSATAQRIRAIQQSADHCGFVAMAEGELVGWIHGFYTFRLESGAFVEIGGLVVDENLRGQGIGRQLIEQVKEWATAKAISKLRVRCNTKRTDTHTFYRKLGFAESKEQKVFDLIF